MAWRALDENRLTSLSVDPSQMRGFTRIIYNILYILSRGEEIREGRTRSHGTLKQHKTFDDPIVFQVSGQKWQPPYQRRGRDQGILFVQGRMRLP